MDFYYELKKIYVAVDLLKNDHEINNNSILIF